MQSAILCVLLITEVMNFTQFTSMLPDVSCHDDLTIIIIMLWCIFMVLCFNFVAKVRLISNYLIIHI